jgi:hypothetical protein
LTRDMRRRAESRLIFVLAAEAEAINGEEEAGGVGKVRASRMGRALVGVRSMSSSSSGVIKSKGSTEEREEAGVEGEGDGERRFGPQE